MLKVRFLSFGIVYFQVLGFARPTSYAMLCLRGRCGVSCHKRWMSVCGCWLRCWVAHGCAKRSSGQIQVDVWNPELPVCATLVGGLPVSVGCWTPPFTRGRCSGELKLQSGNETARSSGVNEALMV